jgi:YidC/Oxa1 family membrane protein insertase
MQELAPELKKLQEKYKDDKQALAQAQMELYRKHGINPLGSCFWILLQMPIYMGLYYAFQESISFRLAGFLWMDNLAAPDRFLRWGEGIPFISRPEDYGNVFIIIPTYLGPYLNVLPIIAIALMVWQQRVMTPPPTDESQAQQQSMMKYFSIFFGLLFYKVAAGLCIYFIASSVWGFAERMLLPKKKPVGAAGPEPAPSAPRVEVAGAAITTAPAKSGGKKGRNKRRRDEGARGPGAKVTDKPQGWFSSLRDWWDDFRKQAEKK